MGALVATRKFMPIWSYIYLVVLFLASIYLIVTVKPLSIVRIFGEVISVISYTAIFIISYNIIDVNHPITFASLFFVYALLWGVIGYKEHYSFYWMSADEFAKTVELGENESFEDAVLSIKVIKSVSVVLIILLVSPMFYVYSRIIWGGN
jgi:hypothetical protein